MFAGLLAAGTTTMDGEGREIDTGLIEGAALTFSPEEIAALSPVLPVFGIGQLFAC